jgi:hypothetical protein
MRVGAPAHKELLCRFFIETHTPYDPDAIEWPALDDAALARLRALPFWGEAASTEREVARTVQGLAPLEPDPLLREAIALQGYEEGRHATLIQRMTAHYALPVPPKPESPPPADVEWAFLRTGYGECFDSFFAFGLFRLAAESGFFPPALLARFDPLVQEEVRHVLFFVNWIAYRRARMPPPRRPLDVARCARAMVLQVWDRAQTARGVDTGDFMLKSSDAMDLDISPGRFLRVCLAECERRFAAYDPRLLRPRLVPGLARLLARVLK